MSEEKEQAEAEAAAADKPMLKAILIGCLLLPAPAVAQDAMRYHVRHITVLAEDGDTRVLRYAPRKGEKTPVHSHPASVVYVVRGGRVKFTGADGAQTITTLKAGTALLRPPVTHADEALDDVELILVEIKPQARRHD